MKCTISYWFILEKIFILKAYRYKFASISFHLIVLLLNIKNQKMDVRKAVDTDIEIILDIIDEARNIMRENGNTTQWSNGYPSREIILEDIMMNQAFLCMHDNTIVGYFCFIEGKNPDPNYNTIEGAWLNNNPYGVIHRLASGRKAKGIAQKAFDFAFTKTKNVRVDTHHDNLPMQNFLKKNGFEYCGVIFVSDGTPRDAFQKELT